MSTWTVSILFFTSSNTLHHHHFHKIDHLSTITCLPASPELLFCNLPVVQFPSASTLGLMYNNMQLTSISFKLFSFKVSLYFKNILFPEPKYMDRMQMKVTNHLVQILWKMDPVSTWCSQFLLPPVPSSVSEAYFLQCFSTYFLSHMQVTTNYVQPKIV